MVAIELLSLKASEARYADEMALEDSLNQQYERIEPEHSSAL